MSDLEEELLGLAEDDPHRRKKKGGSKSKSTAYIEDSDDEEGEEEMDMDIDDSDDDEGPSMPSTRSSAPKVNKNPYPLEGKYVDEDDRDALDALPEIERENILAGRLEEMQKFKDSMQLDMMYKMAGAGGDDDDDDDDDGPSRKRRKHTSVTKEASKAMKDLRNKRQALGERAQRRAARRERRHSPTSDSHSTEDGEISKYDTYRRSDFPSPPPKAKEKKDSDGDKVDLDATAPNHQELNSARVSRYEIVDMMYKDGFEDVITGSYVRLMAKEPDPKGRPKYRVHKVVSIDDSAQHGKYSIEFKGRSIMDSRGLVCAYGKATRLFRIADVSNGDFEKGEFDRFEMTNRADGVRGPKRSELRKKHDAIKELRDRAMTNEEIDRQVVARKQANPLAQRSKAVVEISQLIASRNLALRRNDLQTVHQLEAEIIKLGGDPSTGQLIDEPSSQGSTGNTAEEKEDYDARIQRINDNNKKRTKEAMAAAHLASIQRRKAEEAIVKAKHANPSLAEIKAAVPPASGLKKGETPQQYVARTIDLDLGDF